MNTLSEFLPIAESAMQRPSIFDGQTPIQSGEAKQAALTAYQSALPLPFTFAELWHALGFSSEVYS
tara:strand:+ start:612 stop:809 length:198 start_codon:yes stop_codon:yes gene_type:complete